MTLGEKISDLRKNKGLSQEKLAELMDVSRQAVTKWESGKANPDTENLIRLAEIFGVSLDELCGKEAEKPKKINYAMGHILCLLSVLILTAYCVIGGITGSFNGEILILLIILAVPMHCFTHLMFWGMAKSGEFSFLAGYDDSVKYDTEAMKRYVTGLDFMLDYGSREYAQTVNYYADDAKPAGVYCVYEQTFIVYDASSYGFDTNADVWKTPKNGRAAWVAVEDIVSGRVNVSYAHKQAVCALFPA